MFGAPYAEDDQVPSGLVDHVVELDVLAGSRGEHDGFPMTSDGEAHEFVFDPVGIHVTPGDIVEFRILHHEHTVTSFKKKYGSQRLPLPNRVPEDVDGFTSPVMVGGESWLYHFTEQGVYDLFCFPHLGLGMVIRIVVTDPNGKSLDSDGYGPLELPSPNPNKVLNNSMLEPANIVEEGAVAWEDLDL